MTYDWHTDAIRSWEHAISMKALEIGSRRFASCWELYYCESRGIYP